MIHHKNRRIETTRGGIRIKHQENGGVGEVKTPDKYRELKTFEFPNALVRVYFPDLTPEEKARRRKQIGRAAVALLQDSKQKSIRS